MFSNGLFSMGLAGPLVLLGFCIPAVELLLSAIALLVRHHSAHEFITKTSRMRSGGAVLSLVIAGLLPICGFIADTVGGFGLFHICAEIEILLLWPVSVVLVFGTRGVERKILLIGHGVIAFLVSAILISIRVQFGKWPTLL